MGYTYKTPLVNNQPQWKEPLSEDTMVRGALLSEQNFKQAQQIGQQGVDSIMGIKAISPADEEVLRQRQQEFQQSLQGLDVSSLSNPQTLSKVNNLISRFSNDPDVLAIATRSSQLQKDMQIQKEYEMKGKQYVSPLQRQAQKYIQEGNYYRDARFNKSGFIAPDDNDYNEIAKNTPEWENFVTSGRYDIHQKGKAESSLASNAYNAFKTVPKFYNQLNDQFEQSLEDVSIEDIHNQGIEGVKQLFPHLPLEAQQQALAKIEEGYKLQQNNPYIGNAWKDKLKDDYIRDQAMMYAQAKTYVNTVGKEANEFSKMAVQHQNAKELVKLREETKNQYKQVAGNTKIDPVRRARLVKAATELGTDISDPTQPDGYLSNEALDDLGILKSPKAQKEEKGEVVREDVGSVRELYSKDPNKVQEAIKTKIGGLGINFGADDIENVEWNKDTNRYEVTVDDGGYGTSKASFTQEEFDSLKGTTSTERTETGRFTSPSTGKIKITYSDGTEEIIDGK